MFRTKSLSNREMSCLVEKYRPSKCQKQNRNYSLRTLIADKTSQYHRHMEKLVKQTCEIIYSNKKSQGKSTPKMELSNSDINNLPGSSSKTKQITQNRVYPIEVKQFVFGCESEQTEYLPSLQDSLPTISQEAVHDCSQDSDSEPVPEAKSAFKINLENEQLACQNNELRRQIQHLQQRLQIAQLIKIQKQSQSQGLKLKLKMLSLKLQQMIEKAEIRHLYYTKFTMSKPININLKRTEKVEIGIQTAAMLRQQEIQTNQTIGQIQSLQKQAAKQGNFLKNLQMGLRQFGYFIEQFKLQKTQDNRLKNLQHNLQQYFALSLSNWKQFITEIDTMNKLRMSELQKIEKQYQQSQQQHTSRVNKLVRLLGLAQKQIKTLLARLREYKDQDVTNFKEINYNIQKLKRDPNSTEKDLS